MKWAPGVLWILAIALVMTALAPAVLAQEEHGEVGVYADMTRLHNLHNDDFWGVGGRLGFNLAHWLQLEGDVAYDFSQQFSTPNSTTFTTNTFGNLRLLDGRFGPKFQTGIGPVKAFLVLKGGFINFGFSGLSGTAFRNQVGNVPNGETDAVFYPGVGLEFFAGKIGLRAEAGDEMYFQNGPNHNLKLSFGPQFRF
jgi:Outer membrane protein beta-barrel domain